MPSRLVRPSQDEERRLHSLGFSQVAGIDEVGRGSLAGPVVAAAVVLPDLRRRRNPRLALVRDSKMLTPRQRQQAASCVREVALGVGVGAAGTDEIEGQGIVPATHLAMARALEALTKSPEHLLVDALRLTWGYVPCTPVVRGDQQCTAIAAASVVAKVYRDELMADLDAEHPGYGFARHKGYGTRVHLEALARLGPTPVHRRNFLPLRGWLEPEPEKVK